MVKFLRICKNKVSKKLIKYQENITSKEVALSKIPRIFREFQELLNFQELQFREFGISNCKNKVSKNW